MKNSEIIESILSEILNESNSSTWEKLKEKLGIKEDAELITHIYRLVVSGYLGGISTNNFNLDSSGVPVGIGGNVDLFVTKEGIEYLIQHKLFKSEPWITKQLKKWTTYLFLASCFLLAEFSKPIVKDGYDTLIRPQLKITYHLIFR